MTRIEGARELTMLLCCDKLGDTEPDMRGTSGGRVVLANCIFCPGDGATTVSELKLLVLEPRDIQLSDSDSCEKPVGSVRLWLRRGRAVWFVPPAERTGLPRYNERLYANLCRIEPLSITKMR